MVAALQGFYSTWPFQGGRVAQFKQIVNAFPPIVALHLGCAVSSALTGEHQDYRRENQRLASSLRMKIRRDPSLPVPAALTPTASGTRSGAAGPRVSLDLRKLARQGHVELEAESALLRSETYPPQVWDEDTEAEDSADYWETIRAVQALQAGVTAAGEDCMEVAPTSDGIQSSP